MAGEGAHYGYNPIAEDVQQFIYQITAVDTPVYDDIGDSRCNQPVHTWQNRSLTTRQHNAAVEGASFTDTDLINTTLVTNTTQIISKVITVTETTQATEMHAIEDVFGDQMVQRGAEFKTDCEHALIRGSAASGSATDTARRMDGFFNVISTNASAFASGTTFTEAHLNDWIRDINDQGGRAQDLYVGSVLRQRVSTFIANNTRFMDQNEMKTVRPIGVYQSEFFVVTIHFSRDIPTAFEGSTNAALMLDISQCSKAWLRTPVSFRLPKTNDAQRGVIIGEATLAFGNEASHGLRTVLS